MQNATGTRNEKWHKSDTSGSASVHGTNESTGTLAGVSGADLHTIAFVSVDYRNRAEAATSLCLAIADCDPKDAIVIMDAALADLRQKVLFDGNPHFAAAVAQYRLERTRSGRAA